MADLKLELGGGGSETASAQDASARELMIKVGVCLRLATMHRLGNAALEKPIDDMIRVVNHFAEQGGEVRVQCVHNAFFVNRRLVKMESEASESFQIMRRVIRRLGVHEIAFRDTLDRTDMGELLEAFQRRLWAPDANDRPRELHPKVALRVLTRAQRDALLRQGDRRQEVLRDYVVLALAARDLIETADEKAPRVAGLRRAVQLLFDAFDRYEPMVIGLTRFPNPDGRAWFHAAAVTALVMLMSKRLGLKRHAVAELAIATVLSDVAQHALSDPFGGVELTETSAQQAIKRLERVPVRSALRILAGELKTEAVVRAAMAYEANLPVARPAGAVPPSAAARMIAVARAYQALTVPPPPRRGLSPERALALILAHAGERFDPTAASLLVEAVGRVPIGTVVELQGGRVAVVCGPPTDPRQPGRPPVRTWDARSQSSGDLIDLAEETNVGVSGVLDPWSAGVPVAKVLIDDAADLEPPAPDTALAPTPSAPPRPTATAAPVVPRPPTPQPSDALGAPTPLPMEALAPLAATDALDAPTPLPMEALAPLAATDALDVPTPLPMEALAPLAATDSLDAPTPLPMEALAPVDVAPVAPPAWGPEPAGAATEAGAEPPALPAMRSLEAAPGPELPALPALPPSPPPSAPPVVGAAGPPPPVPPLPELPDLPGLGAAVDTPGLPPLPPAPMTTPGLPELPGLPGGARSGPGATRPPPAPAGRRETGPLSTSPLGADAVEAPLPPTPTLTTTPSFLSVRPGVAPPSPAGRREAGSELLSTPPPASPPAPSTPSPAVRAASLPPPSPAGRREGTASLPPPPVAAPSVPPPSPAGRREAGPSLPPPPVAAPSAPPPSPAGRREATPELPPAPGSGGAGREPERLPSWGNPAELAADLTDD